MNNILASKLDDYRDFKKYLVYYTNISNEDFFKEPLGSEKRIAKNVNIITMTNNKESIINKYNTLSLVKFNENSEKLTQDQLMNFFIIETFYKDLLVKTDLYDLFSNYSRNLTNKSEVINAIKNATKKESDFYLFDNIDKNLIDTINEYAKFKKFGIDTYLDSNLPFDDVFCFIVGLTLLEYTKSTTMINTMCERYVDYHVAEIDIEDFAYIMSIVTVNFTTSLTKEESDKKFPMYKKWSKLDVNLYERIKDKSVKINTFVENTINESKTNIKEDEQIEFDVEQLKSNIFE